ncbi:hypothetical protein [Streptomyces sp. NPDC001508]|uniref:hypothetical protein n=1 Tax=Streptomyces sp. NPDC001508 TaxID=3154656 RepID=UPI00331C1EBE
MSLLNGGRCMGGQRPRIVDAASERTGGRGVGLLGIKWTKRDRGARQGALPPGPSGDRGTLGDDPDNVPWR